MQGHIMSFLDTTSSSLIHSCLCFLKLPRLIPGLAHQMSSSNKQIGPTATPTAPAEPIARRTTFPPLPLHWNTSSFILSNSDNTESKIQTDPQASDYDPNKVRTVPTLMPHFSDDPKSRFLDEMARDAHEHSGWKVKGSHTSKTDDQAAKAPGVTQEEKHNDIQEQHDLSQFKDQDSPTITNGSETKKRPASDSDTQQDQAAEKRVKTNAPSSSSSSVPLITLRALMRERQAMDDLPIDEFWERMGFRQECCSGNAVGVLVILFTRLPSSPSTDGSAVVERQPLSLPYKVLGDLVFKSLMKDTCEWSKVTLARQLTESWFQGVDREVRRKGGAAQFLAEENKKDQDAVWIGKGTIWADFVINGPTKQQMDQARKQVDEQSNTGGAATATAAATGGGASTNMLSVKRKKKPTG